MGRDMGGEDGWGQEGVVRQGVLLTQVPSVLGSATDATDFQVGGCGLVCA